MKLKQWILFVAMMGVLFATAFANDNDELNQRRTDAIKKRIAFFKENIKPKVDAQRNKLEAVLKSEDKQEISKLRKEIIEQRLLENEFLFEAREGRIKGEAFDEGLAMEIEAQKIVIENLMDQAKLIANKYRPEIDDLVAELRVELKDEREQMKPQGERIGNRNRGQGREGFNNPEGRNRFSERRGGFGPGFQSGYGFGGFGGGMERGMDIVTLLLWDVNRG